MTKTKSEQYEYQHMVFNGKAHSQHKIFLGDKEVLCVVHHNSLDPGHPNQLAQTFCSEAVKLLNERAT